MVIMQVTFNAGKRVGDQLADAAEWYLALLAKNGQLDGDYVMGWVGGKLTAYVLLPDPEACQKVFHSEVGRMQLGVIRRLTGSDPSWSLLGNDATEPATAWESASSLYLFTHAYDQASPVCHGDTGASLPTYRLPVTERCREHLHDWALHYRELDSVWFSCGALEIPAYEQLVEPDSELSKSGRGLCGQLETVLGKPTYYCLHRYWGRAAGESDRLCPGCGRPWRARPVDDFDHLWHEFAFHCQPCRLVSSDAATTEDDAEPYAHIGEYKQKYMLP
jgi:predicted  nucleic acid-binding Zn ribbon protein